MDIQNQNRNVTAFIGRKATSNQQQAVATQGTKLVNKRLAFFGFMTLVGHYYPDVRTSSDLKTIDPVALRNIAKKSIDCVTVFNDVWDNDYLQSQIQGLASSSEEEAA